MGLEEVTANFHYGLAESAATEDPIARRGYPTVVSLGRDRPTVVNYIMAVAGIPAGFDRVRSIVPAARGVTLEAVSGTVIEVPVDLTFLKGPSVM
jgi:hypothetical protein